MPCVQVNCRDARSMSCWQKVRVVSVYLFHAAFSVLANSKLGWLFVQLVQIHNEQSLQYQFANFIIRPRMCRSIACNDTDGDRRVIFWRILVSYVELQYHYKLCISNRHYTMMLLLQVRLPVLGWEDVLNGQLKTGQTEENLQHSQFRYKRCGRKRQRPVSRK